MKYTLKQAIKGEYPVLGHRYEFDYAVTRTTPKNDQDEEVFEWLVSIGEATRVPETPAEREQVKEEPPPVAPALTDEEA